MKIDSNDQIFTKLRTWGHFYYIGRGFHDMWNRIFQITSKSLPRAVISDERCGSGASCWTFILQNTIPVYMPHSDGWFYAVSLETKSKAGVFTPVTNFKRQKKCVYMTMIIYNCLWHRLEHELAHLSDWLTISESEYGRAMSVVLWLFGIVA